VYPGPSARNQPLSWRRGDPPEPSGAESPPRGSVTVGAVTSQPADSTATALRETLREATGRPDLDFRSPPEPLTGGFYAEMLRFRLADPAPELEGELVARILPNPELGEWEALIQSDVADRGFPTPRIRLTVAPPSALGRYLMVMDHVEGRPPLGSLEISGIGKQIPNLLRRLPDQLAGIAAQLHALDPGPLAERLDRLDGELAPTTVGFVERHLADASALGLHEIADAAQRLVDTQPRSEQRAITHGDLHPFNLLITANGPVLIDWSVARVAHPGFTLGFTQLMLANPPIPLPRAGAVALRGVGRLMARRFLATYRRLASPEAQVDQANLDWHRKVHALRILMELAGWDALGTRPTSGHPWLVIEPVARRELELAPRTG
jgi:aminoglycoside phosphotransferase (APT) family kinase protein